MKQPIESSPTPFFETPFETILKKLSTNDQSLTKFTVTHLLTIDSRAEKLTTALNDNNTHLKKLTIRNTNIGFTGAASLARLLMSSSLPLSSLTVTNNTRIETKGINSFVEAAAGSRYLTTLVLQHNGAHQNAAVSTPTLTNALSNNMLKIIKVPLAKNTTEKEAQALGEVLAEHPTLKELDLSGSQINDACAEYIYQAVKKNPQPITLKLDNTSQLLFKIRCLIHFNQLRPLLPWILATVLLIAALTTALILTMGGFTGVAATFGVWGTAMLPFKAYAWLGSIFLAISHLSGLALGAAVIGLFTLANTLVVAPIVKLTHWIAQNAAIREFFKSALESVLGWFGATLDWFNTDNSKEKKLKEKSKILNTARPLPSRPSPALSPSSKGKPSSQPPPPPSRPSPEFSPSSKGKLASSAKTHNPSTTSPETTRTVPSSKLTPAPQPKRPATKKTDEGKIPNQQPTHQPDAGSHTHIATQLQTQKAAAPTTEKTNKETADTVEVHTPPTNFDSPIPEKGSNPKPSNQTRSAAASGDAQGTEKEQHSNRARRSDSTMRRGLAIFKQLEETNNPGGNPPAMF